MMRGELLSAVSESFMLSVEREFEPLEPLFDAIVIIISCEGRSILDFGLVDRVSKIVEFGLKKSPHSTVRAGNVIKLQRWT